MRTETIQQRVLIKAKPIVVYNAFMNEKAHSAFTGYKARLVNKEGGKFITCGERNFGYSLFLRPGQRIIQAWSHRNFPDQVYSVIDIRLEETAAGYTQLRFTQSGTPASCVEWLIPGWKSTYWKPLKAYLEKGVIQERKE